MRTAYVQDNYEPLLQSPSSSNFANKIAYLLCTVNYFGVCLLLRKRDHRTVLVGDALGRIHSCSVTDILGRSMAGHWLRDDTADSCNKCRRMPCASQSDGAVSPLPQLRPPLLLPLQPLWVWDYAITHPPARQSLSGLFCQCKIAPRWILFSYSLFDTFSLSLSLSNCNFLNFLARAADKTTI